MGELIFVGLGLSGTDGMTVRALAELKECDEIYAEFYTSKLIGSTATDLERAVGRSINVLDRIKVEEGSVVLDAAKDKKVAFITAGDTMAATTHVDLRIQAQELGIRTELIHGVSIFSAAASSLGLQPYKFGRTVTLPFLEEGYCPRSPYDHILENRTRGLHSMVLLDIREHENRFMSAREGIEWLLAAEESWGGGLMDDDTLICAAARVGSETEIIAAGRPQDVMERDIGGPLHTLIIPGRLHFMEAYSLVYFAGAPESSLEGL
jgi:diphthine synthase